MRTNSARRGQKIVEQYSSPPTVAARKEFTDKKLTRRRLSLCSLPSGPTWHAFRPMGLGCCSGCAQHHLVYRRVYRLMRVPVSGGAPQFVIETHGWNYICANNGEGTCVVLEEAQDHKQVLITAFDPLNGRNRVLRIIGRAGDPLESRQSALSPDGSTCALSKTSESKIQILLLALAGRIG